MEDSNKTIKIDFDLDIITEKYSKGLDEAEKNLKELEDSFEGLNDDVSALDKMSMETFVSFAKISKDAVKGLRDFSSSINSLIKDINSLDSNASDADFDKVFKKFDESIDDSYFLLQSIAPEYEKLIKRIGSFESPDIELAGNVRDTLKSFKDSIVDLSRAYDSIQDSFAKNHKFEVSFGDYFDDLISGVSGKIEPRVDSIISKASKSAKKLSEEKEKLERQNAEQSERIAIENEKLKQRAAEQSERIALEKARIEQKQAENSARTDIETERLKQRAEENAARTAIENERLKQKAEENAARIAIENEKLKQREEENSARTAIENEKLKQRAEENAARIALENERLKQRAEENAARISLENERLKQRVAEQTAKAERIANKEAYNKTQKESYNAEIEGVTRYIRSLEDLSRLVKNVTSQDKIYTDDLSAAFEGLENKIREAEEALKSINSDKLDNVLRSSIANAKYSLGSAKKSIIGKAVIPGSSIDANNIKRYADAEKQAWNTVGKYSSSIASTSWNIFKKTGKTSINFISGLFKGLGKTAGSVWNLFGSRGKSTTSMLANQLRSLAGLFSIYSIINVGKDAITLSSDMIEVRNVIKGVFGDASADIESFAKSAIQNFGLTQLQASKMIGVFGGMLEASNIVGDAQTKMSKNLTALSGDLSSFYNLPVDDVFTKLKSGLAGETEPLRAFGLNMTVANLEAYALSKGIDQSWQSMNQATQQILKYNYILEHLALAQGDFARTSMTWANQVRLLSSNFQQLLSILGGAAIKVLYPVVVLLNQIVSLAIQASTRLANIFGFDYKSLEGQFGVGADMSDAFSMPTSLEVDTSDIDNYSDAMTDAADSTKDFSKETESAGDNLQSFDKLNNITTQDMSDYSDELGDTSGKTADLGNLGDIGGKSLIDPISYIENVKSPAEYANKWLEEWIDLFENKEWYNAGQKLAQLMDKGLNEVYDVLSDEETLEKAEDLGEGLAEFFNGIIDETDLFFDAGKTLGAGINLFTKFFNSFFDTLNWSQLGRDFTIFIKGLVSEVDGYELGRALTQVFAAGIDFLGGAIEDEKTWLALGDTVGDVLNGAIDNIDLAKTIPILVGLAGRLFQAAGAAFETVDWVGLSKDITTGINTAIDNVNPNEFGTTLGNMVMDILTLFEGVLDADWGEAGTKFGSAINSFVDTGATKKFASTAVKFLGKVIELLSSAVKEVEWKDLANSILEGLTEGFNELDPDSQNIMKILLTFLGITGGVGAIGIVVTKLGGLAGSINEIASALKLLFGVSSGAGSLSGATGVLGGLLGLVSKHPLAAAVTAVTAAGSFAYYKGVVEPHTEEMEEAQKNLDNLAESYKGLSDSAKEAYETMLDNPLDSLPFATSDLFEAQVNVMNVIGHFGEANEKLKEYIARGGKMDTFGADIVGRKKQFSELVDEAKALASTLKSIGDLGNYTKLQELLDSSSWVHPEALAEGFYSIIQEYENYNGALISLTDEQRQAIETQLRTHLVEFKNTAGEMVSIAGDTIVGIYRDSEQQIDYLITAAGHAYNTSTQSFTTATKTMRESAVSAVNGITGVFNSDGSVSEAALNLANNASMSTISGFNGMKVNASNAVTETANEIINSSSELTNAVGYAIDEATSGNMQKAENKGKEIGDNLRNSIENSFIRYPLNIYANLKVDTSDLRQYTVGSGKPITQRSRITGTATGYDYGGGVGTYSVMSAFASRIAPMSTGIETYGLNPAKFGSTLQKVSTYGIGSSGSMIKVSPRNLENVIQLKAGYDIDSKTLEKLTSLISKLNSMRSTSQSGDQTFNIRIGEHEIRDFIVEVVRRNNYRLGN